MTPRLVPQSSKARASTQIESRDARKNVRDLSPQLQKKMTPQHDGRHESAAAGLGSDIPNSISLPAASGQETNSPSYNPATFFNACCLLLKSAVSEQAPAFFTFISGLSQDLVAHWPRGSEGAWTNARSAVSNKSLPASLMRRLSSSAFQAWCRAARSLSRSASQSSEARSICRTGL